MALQTRPILYQYHGALVVKVAVADSVVAVAEVRVPAPVLVPAVPVLVREVDVS